MKPQTLIRPALRPLWANLLLNLLRHGHHQPDLVKWLRSHSRRHLAGVQRQFGPVERQIIARELIPWLKTLGGRRGSRARPSVAFQRLIPRLWSLSPAQSLALTAILLADAQ